MRFHLLLTLRRFQRFEIHVETVDTQKVRTAFLSVGDSNLETG